jgi:hypothetical protein
MIIIEMLLLVIRMSSLGSLKRLLLVRIGLLGFIR